MPASPPRVQYDWLVTRATTEDFLSHKKTDVAVNYTKIQKQKYAKKMRTILMSINKRLVKNILCGLQIIKFYTYIKKDDIFLKTSILLNEKRDLQITLHM